MPSPSVARAARLRSMSRASPPPGLPGNTRLTSSPIEQQALRTAPSNRQNVAVRARASPRRRLASGRVVAEHSERPTLPRKPEICATADASSPPSAARSTSTRASIGISPDPRPVRFSAVPRMIERPLPDFPVMSSKKRIVEPSSSGMDALVRINWNLSILTPSLKASLLRRRATSPPAAPLYIWASSITTRSFSLGQLRNQALVADQICFSGRLISMYCSIE